MTKPLDQYKPFREGTHSEFRSSENRCTHIGKNSDRNQVRQFKVDGEIFKSGTRDPRCDFLLVNDTKKTSYYIELKGSDIPKAIDQIDHSVADLSPSLPGYKVFRRIVYRTGTHKVNEAKVLKWKKQHGPKYALCQSRQIIEPI